MEQTGNGEEKKTAPEEYGMHPVDGTGREELETKSGQMRSQWWRCSASMLPFSAYYGLVSLVTSALGSYLGSQVTTLERQFGLSSSQSGVLLSMNDAGFLAMVLFLSYFCRNSHIPRVLGACGFLYGMSALICIIPHVFTSHLIGDYRNMVNSTTSRRAGPLCTNESLFQTDRGAAEKEVADLQSTARTVAMALISLGMFLQGVGKSPRQPLGQTYVDDNVPKENAGLHIGIFTSLAIYGPGLSYAVGASISKIYVTLEDTDMTPRDPRWIGAWWLGFLVFGLLGMTVSVLLCFFPRRLKNAPPREENDNVEGKSQGQTFLVAARGAYRAVWRLCKNSVYLCMLVGNTVRTLSLAAGVAFTPKYLQIHYRLSIFKANLMMGMLSLFSVATAVFISGIITRIMNVNRRGALRIALCTQVVASILFFIGMFLACPQPKINQFELESLQSGIPTSGQDDASAICYGHCNCNGTEYFPVCGSNGVNYYSPCHAGCLAKARKGYTDCSCITNSTVEDDSPLRDAVPGLCPAECSLYIGFAVIIFFSSFINGLGAMPGAVVILRSVSEEDKSLAVGINSFTTSLFGWFLGPIIMGNLIDTTCKLWNRKGSCSVYDIADLRYKFHGVDLGLSVVYLTFYILAYIFLVIREDGKLSIKGIVSQNGKRETKSSK